MPTAQYPAGRVLLEDEGLGGYCVDKKMRDGVRELFTINLFLFSFSLASIYFCLPQSALI